MAYTPYDWQDDVTLVDAARLDHMEQGIANAHAVGLYDAYAKLSDVKPANTEGGTFTAGAWQTRTLNTEYDPEGFVALVANRFTLQPGIYRVLARAPGLQCGLHKAKLADITHTSDALIGSNSASITSGPTQTDSIVSGVIVVTEATVFELQHRCATTKATNGLGTLANFGVPEVYAEIELWRYAA